MNIDLKIATLSQLNDLELLVQAYHLFDSIQSTKDSRLESLKPLLSQQNEVGFVAVATSNSELLGYIALCFGYSIEFSGRDAFIDEFFIKEPYRGDGLGSQLISFSKEQALNYSIKVMHLEVSSSNLSASRFYSKHLFLKRDRFYLMSCPL